MGNPSTLHLRQTEATDTNTAWYAKPKVIKTQRIVGVACIALAFVAFSFSPLGGISAAPGVGLVAAGSVLIGATLVQQVIGESKDAAHGKVKRCVAGVFIMFGGPIGWVAGGILWYLAYKDNKRKA